MLVNYEANQLVNAGYRMPTNVIMYALYLLLLLLI